MKKIIVMMTMAASFGAAAQSGGLQREKLNGYSYFTIGIENVTYEETFPGANSSATVTNPVINTGGLFRVNDKWDFSIDALATFSPNSTSETWKDDSGVATQENKFEYTKAATNILVHYKMTPKWRIVAGPSLTYQTYTRYDLHNLNGYTNTVYEEGDTWEENSTDIFVDAGIAYDTGSLFSNDKLHFSFKAVAGYPIWSETENTRFHSATFDDSGYRAYLDGSISYQIVHGMHIGWYISYSYEKRFEEGPNTVTWRDDDGELSSGEGWLPEADVYSFSTGAQILWKF